MHSPADGWRALRSTCSMKNLRGRDHRAWRESRLLLTPHVARSPEQPPFRWEPLFVENLRRFVAGEALLNVVDVHAGY